MQIIPLSFAKALLGDVLGTNKEEEIVADSYSQDEISKNENYSETFIEKQEKPIEHLPKEKYSQNISNQKQVDNSAKTVAARSIKLTDFDEINHKELDGEELGIDLLLDVPLQVRVELGKCKKNIKDILEINLGSVIALDKMAGEPVDVVINGKGIAKGEVVVIEDNYGIRVTEIASPISRIRK